MEWTVDGRSKNPCTDFPEYKRKEYGVCMKGTLPGAKVGRFQQIQGKLKFIAFGIEDNSKKLPYYMSPCRSDSGSGHWITIDKRSSPESITKEEIITRRALVAVHTETLIREFRLNEFKPWWRPICGSSLNHEGKKIRGADYAHRTTHEDVLKFIKYWVFNTKS